MRDAPFDPSQAWALWRSGVACGLRSLFQSRSGTQLVQAIRLVLCPVDSWRYIEYPAVIASHRGESPILDIGSPKILAAYLARSRGIAVHTSDIVQGIGDECAVYQRSTAPGRMIPLIMDACHIPAPDATYSFVYSVSVIEHIFGNGDTAAMKEIARVLAPGGRAVITVPCVQEYKEIWQASDPFGSQVKNEAGQSFFCRWYDPDSIQVRIVTPSGMRLKDYRLYQERRAGWYARYCRLTSVPRSLLSILVKILDPVHIWNNVEPVPEGHPIAHHGLAVLVFEKPR